jgi:transcriptional regulator with XRE-family HTH domain
MTWRLALGKTIQKLRQDAKLSQEALAHELGITRNQVHRIEIGQSYPKFSTLVNIAVALKLQPDYIIRCAREDLNPQPAGYQLWAFAA